ncbi:T/G mismatch-specific endonuclease [Nitrosovibrio sp. Nv4]|nr:T/G mismatch-specific endonuclease [Nitrosovibrio sp. Nv4]
MRAVRGKNTAPEMIVRRLTHALGYRFRLHRADLPGKPDLLFPARRKIIFVHGCFWHGHDCLRGNRKPKTNADYWRTKIENNRARDCINIEKLEIKGWRVLILWECQMADKERLTSEISQFLM